MLSHRRSPGGRVGKVHFPGGERRDRSSGGQTAGGKVAAFGRCYSPPCPARRSTEDCRARPVARAAGPPAARTWVDCSQCSLTARTGRPGSAPEQAPKVLGEHVGTPTDPS